MQSARFIALRIARGPLTRAFRPSFQAATHGTLVALQGAERPLRLAHFRLRHVMGIVELPAPKVSGSLRTKLLLGYGATLLVSILLVAWAILSLGELGLASASILSENYRSIAATRIMSLALGRQERALVLVASGQPDEGERLFHRDEAVFLQALGRARDNITIEGESEILDEIQVRYTAFLSIASRQMRQPDPDLARKGLATLVVPAVDEVLGSCERLRELNEVTMNQASDDAASLARRAIWTMAFGGAGLVFLGLVVALIVSRRAVQPLRQLLTATTQVAAGDYGARVTITTRDEIGALAHEFNRMVSQLATYDDQNIAQLLFEKQKSDAILRSLDDGVVVLDDANLVSAINPAAANILAVIPGEAIGRHFLEIHRDEQLFALIRRQPERRSTMTAQGAGEDIVTVGPQGEARFYMASVTPIEPPRGGGPGKVLLLRDVTRLKQLDQLKSEFVSTASHELRGPLTSVAMAVGLLRESAQPHLDEKERGLLTAAEEDLTRLRALVSDLLDLSKIESGRLELAFVAMAPSAIIERVIEIFEPQAHQHDIQLSARLADALPLVRVDVTKMTWVLSNLVSNALRYTPKGGFIEIAAVPAGKHVHISVKDSGVGIAPEAQARVFDKFVRVGPDRSAPTGTGLGLAICKEMVLAHGGTIWVESEPGAGSTFTFTLPTVAQGGTQ